MRIFKAFGDNINYNDLIQLDGAFSVAPINYGKSPIFNGIDSKNIANNSRKHSISSEEKIDDVLGSLNSFIGTEKDYKKADNIKLWEIYWLEYINSFDKLTSILPDSIVTVYIGRQAIELGIKYLLLKKDSKGYTTHDLKKLMDLLYSEYDINDNYMDYVASFCEFYCSNIEGGNAEYFRFPEYKHNNYFAGNRLDIKWLSYNISLILLKLIHFAELEDRFE